MKELREIRSHYEFSLDNRQAVLIICGLILMLMLSFLMGTLFGRNLAQMSGSEIAEVAKAPATEAGAVKEPGPGAKEGVSPSPAAGKAPEEKPSSMETSSREELIKRLESMKVPAKLDDAREEAEPAPESTRLAKLEELDDKAPQEIEGDKPVGPAKEKEPEETDKQPAKKELSESEERAVVPAGAYTIQLASFPERSDAMALLEELKSSRYDVYMLHVTLPEKGSFYRVRMGHYEDVDQARKALKILQGREGRFYDAWITQ